MTTQSASPSSIELSIFSSRIEAVCEEMGAVLRRTAFSPNIKDRLDFSCAVFDAQGELCAQAAHIPVHLGSMAYAMADIVSSVSWQEGDMVVVNDPFLGGTHLPDVTVIAPVFIDDRLQGFVVNRAHHANIGASSPGSMPISSCLEEEGIIIPPSILVKNGQLDESMMTILCGEQDGQSKHESQSQGRGDFSAQISANRVGLVRLTELIQHTTTQGYRQLLVALNDYAERLALSALEAIPNGEYSFSDVMDDDGLGGKDIEVATRVVVQSSTITVDFAGTSAQVTGNINCPLAVTAAAVFYVFRCLMPKHTPACAGCFRPINITAPKKCLINAERPAAVAAGNVETSMRLVDVLLGALAQAIPEQIPAASQGTMNNVAMGSDVQTNPDVIFDKHAGLWDGKAWDYYETIGGGMGASQMGPGLSGVQSHMTNTLNTPVESLESHFPLRINRYSLRQGSGGEGKYAGGEGIVREYEFLAPAQVTLLTERRRYHPWGLAGGKAGAVGFNKMGSNKLRANQLNDQELPGKCAISVKPGDRLCIETPGGGGWGKGP